MTADPHFSISLPGAGNFALGLGERLVFDIRAHRAIASRPWPGAMASFVQNKPNFPRFWPVNEGGYEKQSQSQPIRGGRAGCFGGNRLLTWGGRVVAWWVFGIGLFGN